MPGPRAGLMARAPTIVTALVAGAMLLGACGDEGAAGEGGGVNVVATTAIAADVAEAVGGADAEVSQLVPDGSSPHSYAPSAREQGELADSDLVVLFSPNLEQGLPLDSAPRSFAIAEAVDGAGADPHVWLDPRLLASSLEELANEFADIDPDNASAYRERARSYAAQLRELDADLAAMIERIPPPDRKLVTSHDSVGHYADRYGFDFVGAPFGLSPEAEASASALADLITAVEREGVVAVFAQRGDDPEVLRRVGEEAGVEVVDDLLLEGYGGEVSSYPEMMRLTTERIVAALGGSA